MTPALVQLRGVDKAFGERVIYRGLDLDIARGETLAVVGESGSGKSVLLKMLIGLVAPDAGSLRFDGEEIAGGDDDAFVPLRRRIAMLFQGGALFDSLTVADNVGYPLRLRGDEARAVGPRVEELLALVGLPGIGAMMPADLSGGMKKRVALARAIATEPELILYDEPTTGLDPIATRRILELIQSIAARLGVTSVIVTHDLPAAYLVSTRVAMLAERRILATLPTAEFRQSREPSIRAFVSAMAPGGTA